MITNNSVSTHHNNYITHIYAERYGSHVNARDFFEMLSPHEQYNCMAQKLKSGIKQLLCGFMIDILLC